MNTNWDSIAWETQTVPEENEVRVRVEGRIHDLDDRMFRKFQERQVNVSEVTLVPEEESADD
ncbi:hypothetical protein [Natrinema gelatinilyticum]|uniref:hypothetical protein n=1 Tax=Natrinema gelatinilyticum TaxID=2961571 RepID=UPI0020C53F7F|nr:hypothetical protein [Natrinema gelatinilyticum]